MIQTVWNFDYTGSEQAFVTPETGYYKLEVWGASGGYAESTLYTRGGYGSYSVGLLSIQADISLYINVGGSGKDGLSNTDDYDGGYNGGGMSYHFMHNNSWNASGGGATHIATISGILKNLSPYKDTYGINISKEIIIVAGGGGGAGSIYNYCSGCRSNNGGDAGGYIGVQGVCKTSAHYGLGGTQTAGGISTACQGNNRPEGETGGFGYGGNSAPAIADGGGAGGGGGWYGGGGGQEQGGGGGGSGYIGSSYLISGDGITKHMTCYSCTTSTATSTYTISNTNVSATATADYSKTGNGYARITYLGTSI